MAFSGWSDAAIDFYDGLEEDNSKEYWHAHKAIYEGEVKKPMEVLLAELADEFGPGRIFRPNRDVRFSADKSPYKTAIGATFAHGGYVQLSGAGLAVGHGIYALAPDQLQRYRTAVATDPQGAKLMRVVEVLRAATLEVVAHDELKTAPRGYHKDHPRIELLRLKGLVAWKQWPVGPWLATASAKTRVIEVLRASTPLADWLEEHVGPSSDPGNRWDQT